MTNTTKHELLPEAETQELIRLYKESGDQDAIERLLEHNERLISKIAWRYHRSGATGDAQIEDLMQWGRMGLIRAIQTYDKDKGFAFSTYSYWWIRQHIMRYGRLDGQSITMSVQANDQRGRIGKARAIFEQEHHYEPSTEELKTVTGLIFVQELQACTVSIDDGRDSDTQALIEQLTDGENTEDAGSDRADAHYNQKICKYLDTLPLNWRRVIDLRYGFSGDQPRTLADVARELKLSRERIRQIEADSLRLLRNSGILGEFMA